MRNLAALSLLSLAATLGCGSSDDATTTTDAGAPATTTDSGAATTDAGSTANTDAGPAPMTDAATAGTCTTGCATLSGRVLRLANPAPSAGGKGPLFIAVFDNDPVANRANARAVGNVMIADADMSSATAAVSYSVPNITPRAQPYFVIAFLDDNKNAQLPNAGPDRGDLVSLNGFSAPTATLATATTVTLDLSLTTAMPF
jgi:hypothetical protein